jgi:hypothetical protein
MNLTGDIVYGPDRYEMLLVSYINHIAVGKMCSYCRNNEIDNQYLSEHSDFLTVNLFIDIDMPNDLKRVYRESI